MVMVFFNYTLMEIEMISEIKEKIKTNTTFLLKINHLLVGLKHRTKNMFYTINLASTALNFL